MDPNWRGSKVVVTKTNFWRFFMYGTSVNPWFWVSIEKAVKAENWLIDLKSKFVPNDPKWCGNTLVVYFRCFHPFLGVCTPPIYSEKRIWPRKKKLRAKNPYFLQNRVTFPPPPPFFSENASGGRSRSWNLFVGSQSRNVLTFDPPRPILRIFYVPDI